MIVSFNFSTEFELEVPDGTQPDQAVDIGIKWMTGPDSTVNWKINVKPVEPVQADEEDEEYAPDEAGGC